MQGRIQDFSKGGQGNGYMYKLFYIHIAIIHIIILNEVHCNLLKCMNLLAAVPAAQQLYS